LDASETLDEREGTGVTRKKKTLSGRGGRIIKAVNGPGMAVERISTKKRRGKERKRDRQRLNVQGKRSSGG